MMFLTVHGSPLSFDASPVFLRLVGEGDLGITSETHADGSPDWAHEGLADPRGCNTDADWEMCRAFIAALQAATKAAEGR